MQQPERLEQFAKYLHQEEKSEATREKYLRSIQHFYDYLRDNPMTKQEIISYKQSLLKRYKVSTVNSVLIALNLFFRFLKLSDYCVKLAKVQRKIFGRSKRELTYQEYNHLIDSTKDTQVSLIVQTICGTGIRVSELAYITVEAVRNGQAIIHNKNKTRVIFIPSMLRKILLQYVKKTSRKAGPIFITKYGNPPNRSNIWRQMKALCKKTNVAPEKVFPHNLRHLFARTFYNKTKDIVKLADLLGHSSMETTRIYNYVLRQGAPSCPQQPEFSLLIPIQQNRHSVVFFGLV